MMINEHRIKITNILNNRKGFTLVELMVVVFLFMLIFYMAYSVLSSSGNFFAENNKRADAQNESRKIYEAMQKEVGTAASVQIIGTSNPIGITVPVGNYAYFVNDNVFSVMDSSNAIKPLFGSVSLESLNVSFSYIDAKTLKININAGTDFSIETTIFSRNVNIARYPTTLTTGTVLMIKSAV
jgi:type II secretory pathway pseudopilin PulG